MKYILFAHYAWVDPNYPKDLANGGWFVGKTDYKEEAEHMAANEIEDYIAREINNRFDDPEDYPERKEQIEKDIANFRKEFKIFITDIKTPNCVEDTIASLSHDGSGYYESLKIDVIKVGE